MYLFPLMYQRLGTTRQYVRPVCVFLREIVDFTCQRHLAGTPRNTCARLSYDANIAEEAQLATAERMTRKC